jgi:ankyrin repeat protein
VNTIYPEEGDKVAVARLLLERGADPQGHLHRLGRGSDYDRYLEIADAMIDHGANLDERDDVLGLTPLGFGVRSNNRPFVELLLRRGARPNLQDDLPGVTPLAIALNKGFTEMADLFESHGANV